MSDNVVLNRVNKERLRLWVEALRSARFLQGTNAVLSDVSTYCCLGVACEVYQEHADQKMSVEVGEQPVCGGSAVLKQYDDALFVLPEVVGEWLGLFNEEGEVCYDPQLRKVYSDGSALSMSASEWNDEEEATFDDIADLIEENWLKAQDTPGGRAVRKNPPEELSVAWAVRVA